MGRTPSAASGSAPREIAALSRLRIKHLKDSLAIVVWTEPPRRISRELSCPPACLPLQERTFGGLSFTATSADASAGAAHRRGCRLASRCTRTVLIESGEGGSHRVAAHTGVIERYQSLSEIARASPAPAGPTAVLWLKERAKEAGTKRSLTCAISGSQVLGRKVFQQDFNSLHPAQRRPARHSSRARPVRGLAPHQDRIIMRTVGRDHGTPRP